MLLEITARWIVAATVALTVLVIVSVRTPPAGRWLVVTRFGRVVRVAAAGLVFRVPMIEKFHTLPKSTLYLPVAVTARTRDAVRVHLLATAALRVVDPTRAAATADPAGSTVIALQIALHGLIHTVVPAELLGRNLGQALAADLAALRDEFGVQVTSLVVDSLETEITTDLLIRSTGARHTPRPSRG